MRRDHSSVSTFVIRERVEWVQDRYSFVASRRSADTILETLSLLERWLGDEINSASDNPPHWPPRIRSLTAETFMRIHEQEWTT